MSRKVFFDLDETLVFTQDHDPEQDHVQYEIDGDNDYYTIIRPCALPLIDYACDLFGRENVYILTAAPRRYARKINQVFNLGFNEETHILDETTIESSTINATYGAEHVIPHETANPNNLLIDNLRPIHNRKKIELIGCRGIENYLEVRDYYGTNSSTDTFEADVRAFLKSAQERPLITPCHPPILKSSLLPQPKSSTAD